jgi:hypothetical protein
MLAGLTYSNDGDVTGYHIPAVIGADMLVIKTTSAETKYGQRHSAVLQMMMLHQSLHGRWIVVAGYANSNDGDVTGYHGTQALFSDMWVLKLNGDGNIVWSGP